MQRTMYLLKGHDQWMNNSKKKVDVKFCEVDKKPMQGYDNLIAHFRNHWCMHSDIREHVGARVYTNETRPPTRAKFPEPTQPIPKKPFRALDTSSPVQDTGALRVTRS